jgi:dolichol-phosphate mannosyltransferase
MLVTSDAVILIPTFNERENLPSIVGEVLRTVDVHVLVIDDNSPDGTGQIADQMASEDGRVHVLHRPGKQGLGKAYLAGFKWALVRPYAYILEMDADFSHQPRYLPQFFEAIKTHDLVLGSRYISGGGTHNWGILRQMISRGGSLYARSVLNAGLAAGHLKVRDLTGGFKCFRREVLEAINLDEVESTGYAFQIEMTFRAFKKGFSIHEIPIVFYEREAGRSKMSGRIVVEAMVRVPGIRMKVQ